MKPSIKRNPKIIIIVAILVMLAGFGAFMTYKYLQLANNPQKILQQEQTSLVGKVGKLITLPGDEQPSIATVSDKEKLKDQAFFKSAQNGDTLLIYTTAKKAILYREKENRIIEVAPIAIDSSAATPEKK
jgi:hypothetical protein